jgi:hypothetical protein
MRRLKTALQVWLICSYSRHLIMNFSFWKGSLRQNRRPVMSKNQNITNYLNNYAVYVNDFHNLRDSWQHVMHTVIVTSRARCMRWFRSNCDRSDVTWVAARSGHTSCPLHTVTQVTSLRSDLIRAVTSFVEQRSDAGPTLIVIDFGGTGPQPVRNCSRSDSRSNDRISKSNQNVTVCSVNADLRLRRHWSSIKGDRSILVRSNTDLRSRMYMYTAAVTTEHLHKIALMPKSVWIMSYKK